jgi:hypothetical protein
VFRLVVKRKALGGVKMDGKSAESGGGDVESGDRIDPVSHARARSKETPAEKLARLVKAGQHIASRLRDDDRCFQQQAAIEAGIIEKTYYDYLKGDDEACRAFQAIVLPAVYEQAKRAEERAEADIACCESGSSAWSNWHKWKLEKRYRKIYGDLAQAPQQVEHTGKDGGPMQMSQLSVDELLAVLEKTK